MKTIDETLASFDTETREGKLEREAFITVARDNLMEMAKRHQDEKYTLESKRSTAVYELQDYERKRRSDREALETSLKLQAKTERQAKRLSKARQQEQPAVTLSNQTLNGERERAGARVAEIYVNDKRAKRPVGLIEDLTWRRTHEQPLTPEQVQLALEKLNLLGQGGPNAKKLKITYSRNCGCSSCPCSPGYVVSYLEGDFHSYKGARDMTTLWLEVQAPVASEVEVQS